MCVCVCVKDFYIYAYLTVPHTVRESVDMCTIVLCLCICRHLQDSAHISMRTSTAGASRPALPPLRSAETTGRAWYCRNRAWPSSAFSSTSRASRACARVFTDMPRTKTQVHVWGTERKRERERKERESERFGNNPWVKQCADVQRLSVCVCICVCVRDRTAHFI